MKLPHTMTLEEKFEAVKDINPAWERVGHFSWNDIAGMYQGLAAKDTEIASLKAENTTLREQVSRLSAPVSDGYYRAIISDGEISALIHGHSFPGGRLTPDERSEADGRIRYLNGLLDTARLEGK